MTAVDSEIWGLPGPRSFIEALGADVGEGKTVVLELPKTAPGGLASALRGAVDAESRCWQSVNIIDSCPPARLLHERLAPIDPGTPACARSLLEAPRFSSLVVWVAGISSGTVEVWSRFLEDYCHLAREVSSWKRTSLILPVTPGVGAQLPPSDLTLSRHHWRGAVTRVDAMTHAALNMGLSNGRGEDLSSRVRTQMMVELGGYDLALQDALYEAGSEATFDPRGTLEAYAAERGWSASHEPRWEDGTEDHFDGQPFVHSALAWIRGDHHKVRRRLWQGQLSVVFPFLEQQRLRYVERFQRLLRVPFDTPFGTITDRRDFELGQILSQLRSIRLPPATLAEVSRLHRMRNALAHGEPVELADLRRVAGPG